MFKKLRGLLLGLGTAVLLVIGVGAAGVGAEQTSLSLPSLLLNSDDLPRGAVLEPMSSGPLSIERVKAMGIKPKVGSGVPPASIRTWTFPGSSTALRVLVAEAFTPSWAVEGLRSTEAGMRRRGFVPFATSLVVPGSIGFTGILTQIAVSGIRHPTYPLYVAGAACLAWAVGLVVVFAPGGVGVREVVYVWTLRDLYPRADLQAAAISSRLVTVLRQSRQVEF